MTTSSATFPIPAWVGLFAVSAISATATATPLELDAPGVNDAPVITAPAQVLAVEDSVRSLADISVADVDDDGGEESLSLSVLHGTLSFSFRTGLAVTAGTNGSSSLTVRGRVSALNTSLASLSYRPAVDWNGLETLSLTLDDLGHSGAGGPQQASIQIEIVVAPVNDAPFADDDFFTVRSQADRYVLDLLANDIDARDAGQVLSITSVTTPQHASVSISSDGKSVLVTPELAYCGPDAFSYTVSDGAGGEASATVTLEIGIDPDDDGLCDGEEYRAGTNPDAKDTDADGLDDRSELRKGITDPVDDDTDDDGLLDGTEDANHNGIVDAGETHPGLADTDGDLLPDGLERGLAAPEGRDTKSSSFLADTDPSTRTDPLDADTDDDGLTDGAEDADRNGAVAPNEPDPNAFDTDGDGLFDGTERGVSQKPADTDKSMAHFVADADPTTTTDPADADTDDDGLSDGDEDTGHDGRLDAAPPWRAGETDPLSADSDGDVIFDGTERGVRQPLADTDLARGHFAADKDPSTQTDPAKADTDGDGLSDGVEDKNHDGAQDADETAPESTDTDRGGISDGDEIARGGNPLDREDDADSWSGCASTGSPVPLLDLFVAAAAMLGPSRRRRRAAQRL